MGRGCLGRRRYTVFGTSTFGGLAGMGFRTFLCTGLGTGLCAGAAVSEREEALRVTPPVYPAGAGQ